LAQVVLVVHLLQVEEIKEPMEAILVLVLHPLLVVVVVEQLELMAKLKHLVKTEVLEVAQRKIQPQTQEVLEMLGAIHQ
jgi:hypothetical protein